MDPNWLQWFDNTIPEEPLGGQRGYKKIECVQRYPAPGGGFPSSKMSIGWLRGHVHSVYTFLRNIYEGKPGSPSFDEGAYIQEVMEKAYESGEKRCWIEI